MALSKSHALPTGVSATYHKIDSVSVNPADGVVRVLVKSFLDSSARHAGKTPLRVAGFSFSLEDTFPTQEVSGLFWQKLYSKLKELTAFDGATDV